MINHKIRCAVVGCGNIGKRHAAMIAENEEATLAALIDVRPKEELAIDGYHVPFFSSLNEFLKSDEKIDVVSITTPNGFHYAQAMECLQKGYDVVIEKPVALSKAQAQHLFITAQEKKKNVFPIMQNRYSPPSRWIKEVLETGILGKIYLVQTNCFWNRDERYYREPGKTWRGTKDLDGGTLFTQFSHYIDIVYWLFGDIKNIHSTFSNFNHTLLTSFEDTGVVTFELENGGMGNFNFSTSVWKSNLESSLTIIAENGSVKIGGQYMNEILECRIKDYTLPELPDMGKCNSYGNYSGSAANHQFVFENVISFLKGKAYELPKAEESLAVIGIIERMYSAPY